MRQNNPFENFHCFDLLCDDGEPGNAFWGYHVANNFSRLMGVEGTAYFESLDDSINSGADWSWLTLPLLAQWVDSPNGPLNQLAGGKINPNLPAGPKNSYSGQGAQYFNSYTLTKRRFNIPTANMGFLSFPPIVQTAVFYPWSTDWATAPSYTKADSGLRISDPTFDAVTPGWSQTIECQFQTNANPFVANSLPFTVGQTFDIIIGSQNEIIGVTILSITRVNTIDPQGGVTYITYAITLGIVARGKYGSPIGGVPTVGDIVYKITSATVNGGKAFDYYIINSVYCEVTYDAQGVHLLWLPQFAGTVVWKIFGVA